MKKYVSHNVEETQKIAEDFAKTLKSGDVLAFTGGLGAGKTAFVRGLAKGLNVKGEVCSPTFSIVHEYIGKINLVHFDMYRVSSVDDLYTTGFFDYLDQNVIMAVEWSENISAVLPENTVYINICCDENEPDTRYITISSEG